MACTAAAGQTVAVVPSSACAGCGLDASGFSLSLAVVLAGQQPRTSGLLSFLLNSTKPEFSGGVVTIAFPADGDSVSSIREIGATGKSFGRVLQLFGLAPTASDATFAVQDMQLTTPAIASDIFFRLDAATSLSLR
jgi:hypothetical protein